MDRQKFALLEALKAAALARGELRLYRRGKLSGLFAQRTRGNAEIANQAVQTGLIEVTRVEPIGKTSFEWVRVTQKGLDFLLESESPAHALAELRDALAVNEQGMPRWVADMNARIDALAQQLTAEVAQMRVRMEQVSQRAVEAIDRIEAAQHVPTPDGVPWAQETLEYLDGRKNVGLGERCPIADLYVALKEKHADMTIKDYHAGLKRMHEGKVLALLPSAGNGDAPGPEYALLDGPAVYYYVGPLEAVSPLSPVRGGEGSGVRGLHPRKDAPLTPTPLP
jgi:hypothetical protein